MLVPLHETLLTGWPRPSPGSVLSILTGKQNDPSYKGSDLDLFLVGLKPEEVRPLDAGLSGPVCSPRFPPTAHPEGQQHYRADQVDAPAQPEEVQARLRQELEVDRGRVRLG